MTITVVAPSFERDALIALYNSTKVTGRDWMNTAVTHCDWYGVTCSNGSVVELRLTDNELCGSIPPELGNLTNLTTLELTGNDRCEDLPFDFVDRYGIDPRGVVGLSGSIPPELGNLTNLISLDLGGNNLSGSIPSGLGNLTNLTELYLNNNSLAGSIPSWLGNLKT